MYGWCAVDLKAEAGSAPVTRRELLCWGAALLSVAGFRGGAAEVGAAAFGGDGAAFAAGSLADVLTALGGQPTAGTDVSIAVPDAVENGALVPVEVTSHVTGPQAVYIISESNPYPLVARFFFPEGTLPFVATRIKVAQSCTVYAVVKADDRLYMASKHTNVTVGGCGD